MHTSHISTEKWFSFYACVSSLGMTLIDSPYSEIYSENGGLT